MRYNDMHSLIGDTPLVRLHSGIFAKLELWNPSGSVKDRIGAAMIDDAVAQGLLRPGGTIVEATAGNTGLGIAFAALGRGYKCIFCVPTKFSEEKQVLLRALGAQIVNTPREAGMLGAAKRAEEIRESIPDSIALRQFENPQNPQAHYNTTGPEIWRDTEGAITHLVAGAGSGGTFSGVVRHLKAQNPRVQGVLADPVGSVIGGGTHGDYDIEGIGNDFIAATMDAALIDRVYKVTDDEAITAVRRLAREEGVFAGSSSGAAYAAAVRLQADLLASGEVNPVVVAIFPDRGDRYFSKKIFD